MTRRRVFHFIFFASAVVIFLAVAFFIINLLVSERADRAFRFRISTIDVMIEEGRFEDAEQSLAEISSLARNETEWLRVLKRSYALAQASEEAESFHLRLAQSAVDNAGRSEAIRAVASLALFSDERNNEAVRTVGDGFSQDRFAELTALAALGAAEASDHLTGDLRLLVGLGRRSAPSALFRSAEITGHSALDVNGVLRIAETEGTPAASEEAANRLSPATAREAQILLAYDSANYPEVTRLTRLLAPNGAPDGFLQALRADALALSDRPEEAQAAYQSLIDAEVVSANAYLNLAWTLRDDPEEADRVLREGIEQMPEEPLLRVSRAGLLLSLGRTTEARALIPELPQTPRASLLALLAGEQVGNAGNMEAQLWNLHARFAPSDELAAYFAWYLAGLGDRAELSRLLEEQGFESAAISRFYRAILDVRAGNRRAALEAFETVMDAPASRHVPRREAAYNAALLSQHAGNSAYALELLSSSAFETPGGTALRSAVLTLRAEALIDEGREAEARSLLLRARSLDSLNLRARAVLDKLESEDAN